jgi:hypothetical protein
MTIAAPITRGTSPMLRPISTSPNTAPATPASSTAIMV